MTVQELRDALDAYLTQVPEAADDKVYFQEEADPQPRPIRSADFDFFPLAVPCLLLTDIE